MNKSLYSLFDSGRHNVAFRQSSLALPMTANPSLALQVTSQLIFRHLELSIISKNKTKTS